MKRKTAKEMGLPSRTSLSKDKREIIRLVAMQDKFGVAALDLADRTVCLMNQIQEAIYPLEKRRKYEECLTVFRFTPRKTNRLWEYGLYHAYESSISIMFPKPIKIGESLNHGLTLCISQTYGGYDRVMTRTLTDCLSHEQFLELQKSSYVFTPAFSPYENDEITTLLFVKYPELGHQAKVLFRRSRKLHAEASEFTQAMKKALGYHRSTTSLCNALEVFIPWVIKADKYKLVGAKYGAKRLALCTDVTYHDDMKTFADLAE